jgi:hypothetical protein
LRPQVIDLVGEDHVVIVALSERGAATIDDFHRKSA